jgi:serine/threonine protein kinase
VALTAVTRLGAYEIAALFGAGGMGEVYRARDTKLEREVAIKVLPDVFVSDPERVARFQREAKTLAALNHPHHHPFWSRDGRELFYIPSAGGFAVVSIMTRPTFAFSDPVSLSRGPLGFFEGGPINTRQNDAAYDGRVIAITTGNPSQVPPGTGGQAQFHIVLNWTEELKARVPSQ